jgi:hypothetical protein
VSIWTDPDAAVSAVSVETLEHSLVRVEEANRYDDRWREYLLERGNTEMAALFGVATRNCNPADFAFRDIATLDHASFDRLWEELSAGDCWNVLEPALREVAGETAASFSGFALHTDAVLGVNSRRDWFDHTVPLAPAPSNLP